MRIVTAAMLAIGDELLSGRTRDKNIAHLAEILTFSGIALKEVRIVNDNIEAIVTALNALRQNYDYVFTSGGIGPTHDDITADAVAQAFDLPLCYNEAAMDLLGRYYQGKDMEFTPARQRMARMPQGARHIDNPITVAPGFSIGNVYVLAGVPQIFQAMLDNVLPELEKGKVVISNTIACPYGEGDIGDGLAEIQKQNKDVSIGSYPHMENGTFSNQLVVRGYNQHDIDAAMKAIAALLEDLSAKKPK